MAKGGMHGEGVCVWQREVCTAKGGMHGKRGNMRAGETATEAGSTHSTGMHSCLLFLLYLFLFGRQKVIGTK